MKRWVYPQVEKDGVGGVEGGIRQNFQSDFSLVKRKATHRTGRQHGDYAQKSA